MLRSMFEDLATAAERRELSLVYQPIFDSTARAVAGLEALLRWDHPVRGAIPPSQFIPWAEAGHLIVDLGDWVLESACRQIAAWRAAGNSVPRVCINVSARQFEDPGFVKRVRRCLTDTGVRPAHIELELTETVALVNIAAASAAMNDLRDAGIALSIDDFGAGHTSMSLACALPMNALKIDRALTENIASDHHKQAVVACIAAMSRALGLRTIAEGVDSFDSARALERAGCDELQGYYLAPPLHASFVPSALRDRSSDALGRHVA